MYAKIFQQIYDSSLADDWQTRLVFMDMMVLANSDGVVDMTHEAIARRTNVPIEHIRKAIELLESPDSRSRSEEASGARIKRLDDHRDWGWLIINYLKYREIASEDQRKAKTRDRVRRFRVKSCNAETVTQALQGVSVTLCSPSPSPSPSESLGKGTGEGVQPDPLPIPEKLKTPEFIKQWQVWMTIRRGMFKVKDWVALFKGQLEYLDRFDPETASEMLKQSIRNGWRGLFELKPSSVTRPNGTPPPKPMTVFELRTIMEAKQSEATALRNAHYSQAALGGTWDSETSKKKYFQFKREIKDINSKIGRMA